MNEGEAITRRHINPFLHLRNICDICGQNSSTRSAANRLSSIQNLRVRRINKAKPTSSRLGFSRELRQTRKIAAHLMLASNTCCSEDFWHAHCSA
jgi:hypothetical protein